MKKTVSLLCLLLVFMSAVTYASAAAKKDTKAPVITKTNPAGYDTDVMVESNIQIRFSEAVKKGSEIKNISLKEAEIKKVTYTYEVKDNFLILKPKAKLKYDTIYTVTVPAAAVHDLAGNKLAQDFSFSFVTEQNPTKVGQEEVNKAYKYLVELEINMDMQINEGQLDFYSQLLKGLGFDATFKSVRELTPTPTPKVTPTAAPQVTTPPTPIITPEIEPTKAP